MAYQSLGLGSAADDGTGDSLRVGGDKINDNFVEIYTALGSGTALCSGITAGADDFTFVGASYNAVWDKSDNALEFADNAKAIFGTSADLSIYHDGSNSYVSDQGTGLLVMLSNNFRVNNAANSEVMFNAVEDGAVSIYYDNTVHLATDAAGVNITGTLDLSSHLDMPDSAIIKLGTSDDLQIYHNGTDSFIDNNTSILRIRGNVDADVGGEIYIQAKANEHSIVCDDDGAVSLYYDNAVKFATDNEGANITGQLDLSSHLDMPDNAKIKIGTGDDLEIHHNGSHSVIADVGTGNLQLRCADFRVTNADNTETMITGAVNGAVSLYYDDSAKIATSSAGVSVTGTVTATPTAILLVKNSSGTTLKTINGIAAT